jgi:hypothetical protein
VLVGRELGLTGLSVRQDAEVGPCLQPHVVRLAGVVLRRIEILLRVRRCLCQGPVDVRR